MKIYCAHVKNTVNTGDKESSPIQYYSEYFQQFQTLEIDLSEISKADIQKEDFVIVGGGGILNSGKKWNNLINTAFQKSKKVIIWGCGFNSSKIKIDFKPIPFEKALLLGIRDYKHPHFRFVPCVSCKSRYFDIEYSIKRKIGIIKHHSRPLNIDESLKGIDSITNQYSFEQIARFIGESECILSNSYHALYWASLLKKITGRLDSYNNTRFRDCMYRYTDVQNIHDIDKCKVLSLTANDLDYFRFLNDEFFDQVKTLIDKSHNLNYQL